MDKTQLKEWLEDAIEHEESIKVKEAYQDCLDNIGHAHYTTWLSAEIMEARATMVRMMANDTKDYIATRDLGVRQMVFSRISRKLEGGGK